MGMTLVRLSRLGNVSEVELRLKKKDRGSERSVFIRLRILDGMQLGPDNLLVDKDLMVFRTSDRFTGPRKIEFLLGFAR